MRIDSANVGMESARSYQATSISYRRFVVTDFAGVLTGEPPKEDNEETTWSGKDAGEKKTGDNILDLQQKMSSVRGNYFARKSEDIHAETIRQESIMYIFELLFGKFKERYSDWLKKNTTPDVGPETGIGTIDVDPAAQLNKPLRVINYEAVDFYSESEETSFSTTGTVKTADGREINFNIDVSMSRSFTRELTRDLNLSAVQLCDPLVINLDGNVAGVSDQKIKFDIDGDGELDIINQLSSGSGYLALDKNGDGTINDGKELFGTQSGNGFEDLAQYDKDHNGWIDENDAIWDKLKIWAIDENGKEHLYSLAEAGVGALCLKNVSTQFSDTDSANNAKAVIRNTGMFLYENGNVGTLQHLDLVKYQKEA